MALNVKAVSVLAGVILLVLISLIIAQAGEGDWFIFRDIYDAATHIGKGSWSSVVLGAFLGGVACALLAFVWHLSTDAGSGLFSRMKATLGKQQASLTLLLGTHGRHIPRVLQASSSKHRKGARPLVEAPTDVEAGRKKFLVAADSEAERNYVARYAQKGTVHELAYAAAVGDKAGSMRQPLTPGHVSQVMIKTVPDLSVASEGPGRQWSLSRLLSLSWDPNKAHVDPSTPRGGRAPVSPSSRMGHPMGLPHLHSTARTVSSLGSIREGSTSTRPSTPVEVANQVSSPFGFARAGSAQPVSDEGQDGSWDPAPATPRTQGGGGGGLIGLLFRRKMEHMAQGESDTPRSAEAREAAVTEPAQERGGPAPRILVKQDSSAEGEAGAQAMEGDFDAGRASMRRHVHRKTSDSGSEEEQAEPSSSTGVTPGDLARPGARAAAPAAAAGGAEASSRRAAGSSAPPGPLQQVHVQIQPDAAAPAAALRARSGEAQPEFMTPAASLASSEGSAISEGLGAGPLASRVEQAGQLYSRGHSRTHSHAGSVGSASTEWHDVELLSEEGQSQGPSRRTTAMSGLSYGSAAAEAGHSSSRADEEVAQASANAARLLALVTHQMVPAASKDVQLVICVSLEEVLPRPKEGLLSRMMRLSEVAHTGVEGVQAPVYLLHPGAEYQVGVALVNPPSGQQLPIRSVSWLRVAPVDGTPLALDLEQEEGAGGASWYGTAPWRLAEHESESLSSASACSSTKHSTVLPVEITLGLKCKVPGSKKGKGHRSATTELMVTLVLHAQVVPRGDDVAAHRAHSPYQAPGELQQFLAGWGLDADDIQGCTIACVQQSPDRLQRPLQ